jgi:phage-related protein
MVHFNMNSKNILQVVFYRTDAGSEPVREWLKSLDKLERKIIGADIKTVQFGWPLGMPLVRKVDKGLWEVRSHLDRKTARVFFTAHDGMLVLLHGFVKKTQKTPTSDLRLAKQRMAALGGRNG